MRRPQPETRRKSSTIHYQTFPTPPPKSKGQPPSRSPPLSRRSHHGHHASSTSGPITSPLPKQQLAILAFIAVCEQTALNSISPYLPQMVSSFPEVDAGQVGLYVGTVASSFALAQFATNFVWRWLSDRIGRKPVILSRTLLMALGLLAFGFCKTLWQAVLVQVFIGLSNGNQGVVSTCLGEITDRNHQSRVFVYLPVIYGLGGITGPLVGGLLVPKDAHPTREKPYPYLPPNLLSGGILLVGMILSMIFLEESLEKAPNPPPLRKRVHNLFSRVWHSASSSRPAYLKVPDQAQSHINGNGTNDHEDDHEEDGYSDLDTESQASMPISLPHSNTDHAANGIRNRDTICLLASFFIFQLSNVYYSSLYPIFGAANPPTGRDLSPREIGVTIAFAGAATIMFQLGVFGKFREKIGNRKTYCVCMAGTVVAYLLTPWVGYKGARRRDGVISSGQKWLWVELEICLFVRAVASAGCLTSALFLITNSAPNPAVLSRIHDLAQSLSAAGHAVGPFIAGGLFSLATHVQPRGEAMAFGVFGGITFVGFLLTLGIQSKSFEAAEWGEEEGSEEDEDYHYEYARR